VLAQIQRVKEAIFDELSTGLNPHEQMLRLALNEAEALAWQTPYPHLVFAGLAAEKAQSVAEWEARQESILHTTLAIP
jgi:hypothetical protein